MKTIEIPGASRGRCRAMQDRARGAAVRPGFECEIVKVTDPMKFLKSPIRWV